MLAGLFARNDYHEFRDLGLLHPPAELAHDFLDVCFHLVVAGRHHVEAVFLDATNTVSFRYEILSWHTGLCCNRRKWEGDYTHVVKSSGG